MTGLDHIVTAKSCIEQRSSGKQRTRKCFVFFFFLPTRPGRGASCFAETPSRHGLSILDTDVSNRLELFNLIPFHSIPFRSSKVPALPPGHAVCCREIPSDRVHISWKHSLFSPQKLTLQTAQWKHLAWQYLCSTNSHHLGK